MHAGFQDNKRIVRNVFGCNMAFRRQRLLEIGEFNPNLGGSISGDDTDICLKATDGNPMYNIIYEPKAVVRHKVPEKRQTFRYIAHSAWVQGIGKALTKTMHQQDKRALSSEKGYLKSLIFVFLPHQALNIFKQPRISIGKILAVIIVITSIGLGYTLTRTKMYHFNLKEYKNT